MCTWVPMFIVDFVDDVRAICSMISPQTKIINNLNYFMVFFFFDSCCMLNPTAYENRKQ